MSPASRFVLAFRRFACRALPCILFGDVSPQHFSWRKYVPSTAFLGCSRQELHLVLLVAQGLVNYAHRAHAELCHMTGGFSGRICRMLLPLRHSYALRQLVQQQPPLQGQELDEALAIAMARRLENRFGINMEAPQASTVPSLSSADKDLMLPDFLLVSQLLQHESQVAVVHSQVTFCDQEPLKGKDPVLMACGFRR